VRDVVGYKRIAAIGKTGEALIIEGYGWVMAYIQIDRLPVNVIELT